VWCGGLRGCPCLLQVRVPVADLPLVTKTLVDGLQSWAQVAAKYPAQKAAAEE
jgi:hypothetical protein